MFIVDEQSWPGILIQVTGVKTTEIGSNMLGGWLSREFGNKKSHKSEIVSQIRPEYFLFQLLTMLCLFELNKGDWKWHV